MNRLFDIALKIEPKTLLYIAIEPFVENYQSGC